MLAAASWAQAQPPAPTLTLPARAARAGDVIPVRVTVPPGATGVTVRILQTTWPVYQEDATTWRALIGIDLDWRAGTYDVVASVADPAGSTSRPLVVVARSFRTRTLTVAPDYVTPSPGLLARITADAAFLTEAYAHSSDTAAWTNGFIRPVPGRANSSFGTRSVFNGERRNPHAGTDFLSGTGTPVHAPAGGRIVAARDLFFTGNTVIIDHGLGVFSMLAHLSRIDVREGESVETGVVVGLVGATGRVTGPHLHWALRIGEARVDPLSALALPPDPR